MKILYVNPNINHHKLPFFNELQILLGNNNVCYATPQKNEQWRTEMGFVTKLKEQDKIFYINNENFQEFENLFFEYDVVLCAIRDYWDLIERRLKANKLTFYFSERWFKEPIGKLRLLHPKILKLVIKFRKINRYSKFYYLAQGDTAAEDFFSCGIGLGKTFRFGYFPPISVKSSVDTCILPKSKIKILWCGRMIPTKRVDLLANAFVRLSQKYNQIYLCLVGKGPCRNKVERILVNGCDSSQYSMIDYVPNNEVRSLMRESDIYVLPSSGWEGWGAVINEAMSESCAIIAGDKVGAAKSMFTDSVGITFNSENVKSLYNALEYLINNPEVIETQKKAGVQLVNNIWSPRVAAERFLSIVDQIKNQDPVNIFDSGPLSMKNK